ncbi:hypothetical protein Bca52824_021179 [Brassica carinata]|uniref:FBD domain-containing protein n=1 Tax=Brassica carinata TaxID=52824 RepID=A0A8X8B207_BRACI|nr:hypothetical protein Bca52824_021179 [Brassica carinata]
MTIGGSLIIDSPRLKYFRINDCSEDDCLIECMNPSLVMASVHVTSHRNELFLRSLSSVLFLNMTLVEATDVFCSAINFSQLIECKLHPCGSEYWVKSVMLLLHNSPKLKVLMISSMNPEISLLNVLFQDVYRLLSRFLNGENMEGQYKRSIS